MNKEKRTKLAEYYQYDITSDLLTFKDVQYEDEFQDNYTNVVKKIKGTRIEVVFPKASNTGRVINIPTLYNKDRLTFAELGSLLSKEGINHIQSVIKSELEYKKKGFNTLQSEIETLEQLTK